MLPQFRDVCGRYYIYIFCSSEERIRWKIYLQTMWVEIADAIYTFRVRTSTISDDIWKEIVFEFWRSIPVSDMITELNLGEAEDVPGRDDGPVEGIQVA
jgi:hypothetical protein